MAESNSTTIRTVTWSELCPWLSIVRAFRLAITARALVLGALGVFLTVVVWGVIGLTFGADPATSLQDKAMPSQDKSQTGDAQPRRGSDRMAGTVGTPLPSAGKHRARQAGDPRSRPRAELQAGNGRRDKPTTDGRGYLGGMSPWPRIGRPNGPLARCWTLLSAPATKALSQTGFSVRSIVCLILCGLWGVAVWAFFGAAICRMAAVRLAADEQVGIGAALRYASRKWPAYFAAPLLPVAAVAVVPLLFLVPGLIMQSNVGLLLAGLLWPLVLVAGF